MKQQEAFEKYFDENHAKEGTQNKAFTQACKQFTETHKLTPPYKSLDSYRQVKSRKHKK